MPSIVRILEIIIYALLNFLPYMVLAIYPFWGCRRYSKKITIFLIIVVAGVQVCIGLYAALFLNGSANWLSLLSTILYLIFYFWAFRGNIGKMVFTMLLISNICNFTVISSKCLEGILFPALACQKYRWSFSVTLFLVQLLILFPLFFYIKKVYAPAFREDGNKFVWRYLWIIPATFYLCWYYTTYYNDASALEQALYPETTIFLFFINIGSLVTVHVVIHLLSEQRKNLQLEANNHQLLMQTLQYENLQERIKETRRAGHDIRHHFVAISGYLESGDYEGLKKYMKEYLEGLPEDMLYFCEHSLINMLIVYYYQMAKEKDINFNIDVNIPDKIGISDSDLSILFGNLLENAIYACSIQKESRKYIDLRSSYTNGNIFVLTIDNTYENELKIDRDGVYLSTKHKGNGIGIESVKMIVNNYHGICKFEQNGGVFHVSVMLKSTNESDRLL